MNTARGKEGLKVYEDSEQDMKWLRQDEMNTARGGVGRGDGGLNKSVCEER